MDKKVKRRLSLRNFILRFDFILVLTTLALAASGALLIFSATRADAVRSTDSYKQVTWIVLGLIALIITASVGYQRIRNYALPIYIINLVLLVTVILAGYSSRGMRGWVPVGSFRLQPSEFAKVALIIALAAFLAERKGDISRIRDLFFAFLQVGVPLILILAQPDVGTALVLLAILLGMLLVGGVRLEHYIVIILFGLIAIALIINFQLLKDYQMKRFLVFLNPNIDPLGAGYNLLQSKIAIGSGRFWGKGLFLGTQTRLHFIPERHTDFIFSVLGEELGFMGAAILLALYFILIGRSIRIASTAKDLFGALVATGVASMLLFQVLVNVGMTIGIMPIAGLPLPLVSYGGSSMLSNMIAVGLLLNISLRRFK